MNLSTSSIFILAGLVGLSALVMRAVSAARRQVSPVKIVVRVKRNRRQEGK